ncbi:MAG: hypothetical protein V2I82_02020 [Halieaceae bacterium]|nr:hypothetical protein [Halieaceae bacterium]
MLALAGCTTAAPAPREVAAQDAPELCPDTRPQVCTMIYAPVCAEHSDGRRETLASACNACADNSVQRYVDGPCEEGSTP